MSPFGMYQNNYAAYSVRGRIALRAQSWNESILWNENDRNLWNSLRTWRAFPKDQMMANWWISLSRIKKIKSKPFNDRSYEFQIL